MGLFSNKKKIESKRDLAENFLNYKKANLSEQKSNIVNNNSQSNSEIKTNLISRNIDTLKNDNLVKKKKKDDGDDDDVKERLWSHYKMLRAIEDEKFYGELLRRKRLEEEFAKQKKDGSSKIKDYSSIESILNKDSILIREQIAPKTNVNHANIEILESLKNDNEINKDKDETSLKTSKEKDPTLTLILTPVFYDPKDLSREFDKVKYNREALHKIIKERASRTLRNMRKNKMVLTKQDRFMIMTDLDIISRACDYGLDPELVVMKQQFNNRLAYDKVVSLNEYLDQVANFLAKRNRIDFIRQIDDIMLDKDVEKEIIENLNNPVGQVRKVSKKLEEAILNRKKTITDLTNSEQKKENDLVMEKEKNDG